MSPKRRGGYPYSLDDSISVPAPRKPPSRKPGAGRLRWVTISLLILAVVGAVVAGASYLGWGSAVLPKQLVALRLQLNGKEVILMPESQVVLNPRDVLRIDEIQTDGWLAWRTRLVATEVDLRELGKRPVAIRELWPNAEFETAKTLEIEVQSWGRPIGKVSFLVQLDAKDWLQKAAETGEGEGRIKYLENALRDNPGNILVKTQLAGLYFEAKKYSEAARLYEEIDQSGKSRPILEKLLSIHQVQKRVDDALAVFIELLKLSEDPEVFKELLQYGQKQKSKEEWAKFLDKSLQDIPKPFQSSALLVLADLSTQTRNWRKAADSYEKVIRSGVRDPDVLYNLAVTYQQGNDIDKAIQAMERYLQRNPSDLRSWMQLAEMQEKKGAHSGARGSYEAVLQKSPHHKEALVRLVALLEKTNDKEGLQKTYEKLAELQPKNKTVLHNLAVLHYEAKRWAKATESFEALAALDPKDVEVRKYLLDLYRKQKNEEGVNRTIETLAQVDPGNPAYHDTIFARYKEKKDYKGMVAYFRQALERRPDSVALHNYVLYGLIQQGDTRGALKELDELIRLQPKEKKHYRQSAKLHESLGSYGEALKKLDQLLKMDPGDKELKDDYMRVRMLLLSKKKPG
ncbi:MAG: tetratricopeptide repeat protein [Syntrophobacteraceae bacterium]|jgi:tetratricopeptide (TPR) repeat protein|nr:tetratricopeptide repeat protein [Syntrophobacteraceae bacterium]